MTKGLQTLGKMVVPLLFAMQTVAAETPVAVRAAPLAELATYPEVTAPAEVVSLNDSRIEAAISADVAEIPVRVGDVVEGGAAVLQLECADQQSALAQVTARRDALRARNAFADFQYNRARSLVKKRTISDEQLQQRKADALALQAELSGTQAGVVQAQLNVERCTLRAPFRAVVVERLIGVGERAQPGRPLLRLLDLSALVVSAQVAAFDVDTLGQAEELTLQVGEKRYPLQLRRAVPVLDNRSRNRELRLEFSAESALPGSSGRLLWRHTVPHLPAEYLLRRDGRYGVFVLREGRAGFVEVAGAREGSPAATSLPLDTPIITEGRFALVHGDAVSVVE